MGPTHTNLIFDVVLPYESQLSDEELVALLEEKTREKLGDDYFLVVKVDRDYTK